MKTQFVNKTTQLVYQDSIGMKAETVERASGIMVLLVSTWDEGIIDANRANSILIDIKLKTF